MPGHKAKRLGVAKPPNGSWAPFEPGNMVGVVHGASTPRLYSALAEVLISEYLAMPDCEYLGWARFAGATRALAEAEAQEFLYLTWMESLDPPERRYEARGAQSPPIETWGRLQERSAARRKECGLTPLTFARIRSALASAQVDIARLVEEAAAEEGWAGDDPGGD